MADALILETTFLIDLERQTRRAPAGRAQRFLETHLETQLFLTFTIAGELASGSSLSSRSSWETFLRSFHILEYTPDVAWEYGVAYRYLQQNGLLIGANDLWIAATAISYGFPLVTRNAKHFRRVPRLQVVDY